MLRRSSAGSAPQRQTAPKGLIIVTRTRSALVCLLTLSALTASVASARRAPTWTTRAVVRGQASNWSRRGAGLDEPAHARGTYTVTLDPTRRDSAVPDATPSRSRWWVVAPTLDSDGALCARRPTWSPSTCRRTRSPAVRCARAPLDARTRDTPARRPLRTVVTATSVAVGRAFHTPRRRTTGDGASSARRSCGIRTTPCRATTVVTCPAPRCS